MTIRSVSPSQASLFKLLTRKRPDIGNQLTCVEIENRFELAKLKYISLLKIDFQII